MVARQAAMAVRECVPTLRGAPTTITDWLRSPDDQALLSDILRAEKDIMSKAEYDELYGSL